MALHDDHDDSELDFSDDDIALYTDYEQEEDAEQVAVRRAFSLAA